MSASIQLRERTGGPTTCVWCHAGAPVRGAEVVECPGCGALYHDACRDEAGRCGTIGCGTRFAAPPREHTPGRRTAPARCAGCDAEGGVLGLVRCPHRGAVFHLACRSGACTPCRALQPLEASGGALFAAARASLLAVARVLLGVTAAAFLLLFLRGAPRDVGLPYLVLSLGPVLAALALQRWR